MLHVDNPLVSVTASTQQGNRSNRFTALDTGTYTEVRSQEVTYCDTLLAVSNPNVPRFLVFYAYVTASNSNLIRYTTRKRYCTFS